MMPIAIKTRMLIRVPQQTYFFNAPARYANQKALVAAELIKTLPRWGNTIGVTAIAPEIG